MKYILSMFNNCMYFLSYKQMCRLFAKGLKQRESSIFLGLIVMTAFCMGHAHVNIQRAFWQEPVIVWIAALISTGELSNC